MAERTVVARHGRAAKRIKAVVEKGPNYVFHLLAVAGVGFESDYGRRYRHTVGPDDLALLRRHRDLLVFGDGRGGALWPLLIFLPAYLGLDSQAAFGEFYALLDQGFAGGDYAPFLGRYATGLARLRDWVVYVDERWLAGLAQHRGAVRDLGTVHGRNLPAYEREVWPAERPALAELAGRLNAHFEGKDVIGAWERLTGLAFKAEVYEIVLVSAIANGPNANSLGYERNVFWSGSDFGWLTEFISHETGSHLLIDLMKERMGGAASAEAADGGDPGRYDFDLLYRAYENLVRFYNMSVLETDDIYGLGDHYFTRPFEAIYRELHAADPGLSPREMLERGYRAFIAARLGSPE